MDVFSQAVGHRHKSLALGKRILPAPRAVRQIVSVAADLPAACRPQACGEKIRGIHQPFLYSPFTITGITD